jgi:hypothetical protein
MLGDSMSIFSRKTKIVLTTLMSLLFLQMLVSEMTVTSSGKSEEEPNSLLQHIIRIELYSLEVNQKIQPPQRLARIQGLADRFLLEAEKDRQDPLLQAQNLILLYEARANRNDKKMVEEIVGIEDDDPVLSRMLTQLYLDGNHGVPDTVQIVERLGMNWFSLTALIHNAERIGDRDTAERYQNERHDLSLLKIKKLGLLSVLLVTINLAGLFLWLRYFMSGKWRVPTVEKVIPRAPWNLLDGLFVFMFFYWAIMALAFCLEPLVEMGEGWGLTHARMAPFLYGVQIVTGLFLIQLFFFRRGLLQTLWAMGLMQKGSVRSDSIRWGIGGYVATMPLVLAALYLSTRIFQNKAVSENPMIPLIMNESASVLETFLLFVTVSFLAPVFEEIFFRGFLYNSFRARLGMPAGLFLSSLFFALVHFDFSVFFGLFSIGLMLGFVYHRTQSLLAPMILHSLWNTTTLIVVLVLFG